MDGWMHAVRTYIRTYVHAWVHTYNIDIISHGDSANTFTKRTSYLKNEIVISMVKQFQGSIWVGPKLGYQQPSGLGACFSPKTDGHKLDDPIIP